MLRQRESSMQGSTRQYMCTYYHFLGSRPCPAQTDVIQPHRSDEFTVKISEARISASAYNSDAELEVGRQDVSDANRHGPLLVQATVKRPVCRIELV